MMLPSMMSEYIEWERARSQATVSSAPARKVMSRLNVAGIDLERREIAVRDGKRARDRVTILPARLVEPLVSHLSRVRGRHERDLA